MLFLKFFDKGQFLQTFSLCVPHRKKLCCLYATLKGQLSLFIRFDNQTAFNSEIYTTVETGKDIKSKRRVKLHFPIAGLFLCFV